MPHKKAKHSVRQERTKQRGHDAAPTKEKDLKSTNGMPKTMYRILNAERIRAERKGKMKEGETTAEERPRSDSYVAQELKPLPHESLRTFNQRVEQELRPEIASAFKTSRQAEGRANKRKRKREAAADNDDDVDDAAPSTSTAAPKTTTAARKDDPLPPPPLEFAKAQRTRLNDIVMEPPTLSRASRKASEGTASGRMPVTLAQQAAIEEERQRAIKRYRELKEAKLAKT